MANGFTCRKNTAILVTDQAFRKYFSKIDISEGTLIIDDKITYFLDARYFDEYKDDLKKANITPVLYQDEKDIKDYLLSRDIKTLYIDFDKTSVSEFNGYKKFGLKIKDGSLIIKKARSKKSGEELKLIKKACQIIEQAVESVINKLALGKTEIEVASEIEKEIKALGGDGVSFDTIVAFGKNSAVPHHVPSNDKLVKDTVVLIDAGAFYKGYASDITRTIYFGENPDSEFIKVYDAVKVANQMVIDCAKAGMTAVEIDAIARDYLKNQGYSEYFTHSLGHGLGLEIHEYPRLSPKGKGKIPNNTVFTVEPGVYLSGKFGVRIEDTVVMKKGKIQSLYKLSKELLVK